MSGCCADSCCGGGDGGRPVPWWRLGLAGALALSAEGAHWLPGDYHRAGLLLALCAIALGGLDTFRKGWRALCRADLNMNALMSLAVTGALAIGQWPEAAMVMILFTLAERLEERALDRARRAVHRLLALAPEQATVQQPDGSWQEAAARGVAVGSRVRLRPGERVPLDGIVLSGCSSVNQAPITGESLPVEKSAGDRLFAGTINQEGELEFRTTAPADHSTLARIIRAVEGAQAGRAPIQRLVDRFAHRYTPAVFAVALAVALLPPLAGGAPWGEWIYRALVLLVIACPCALVISTPVTIVSGLAAAARHGILIKGGAYLEAGRSLRWLALDKTGTLTHGEPVQTAFIPWADADPERCRSLAAALAARSDHPVSRAVAGDNGSVVAPLPEIEAFTALPGRGVRGLSNGSLYHLGNYRLLQDLGCATPALALRRDELVATGNSVVFLAGEHGALALFAVADTLRETSREAVADLHSLGVNTVILSGDSVEIARSIALQAGIDRVEGELLPEDKLRVIERLGADGPVGMVGDGINDAPALARAHIGFAMGAAGSDTAIDTADVALMDDDLRKIPVFIRLSRATVRLLRQNVTLALGIKGAFLLLAVTGHATMWMAVFADMGTSLLVVGNGLRLLRR
ncbi:heavy metal translocating P-type ATPase [Trichlorobacter ammonificans]|uniref:P-type Zn(2+) transporter n=1 Tax=Trichlorobacter ammonificans TaxID=2916410 RepID=A0ABM9D4S2_9BACT|nr:heavy metal translocating P-type ATPase [Trichlorobacter ammonificans]CAH2030253.1 putative cadmium-transporting ATPase [Trichlorobacter ammonificans]